MKIDGATLVHGIIGNPVAHSLSPALHNRAFAALGMNRVYVAFEVSDIAAAVAGIRGLGLAGLSVTVPHKQAIIPHLDEVEPLAAAIGAVNTVVCRDGRLVGHNTDWTGANRALAREMELAGSRVVLVGAGGAARAIGFGLVEAGAGVVVANRGRERGEALARDLGCDFVPLEKMGDISGDALVNATSVGMEPAAGDCPVPMAAVEKFPVVMDIVYAPVRTRLLALAEAAGCRVVNGLWMLLYQGMAQFELWTGEPAPEEVMRRVIEERVVRPA